MCTVQISSSILTDLVQDVQASCLPPRSDVSNKAVRELLLSKLYHVRMLSVLWLMRLTVLWIGKFIIFIPKCEMFCDLGSQCDYMKSICCTFVFSFAFDQFLHVPLMYPSK